MHFRRYRQWSSWWADRK